MKNFDIILFANMAKTSKNLNELLEKVKASGANGFIKNNKLYTGSLDRFGFVRYTAEMTENGIKCQMY